MTVSRRLRSLLLAAAALSLAGCGGTRLGGETTTSVSADGRYVAFASTRSDLAAGDVNGTYDVFVRDTLTNEVECASVALDGTPGNGVSTDPSISGDGRFVAFASGASDLVDGDANGVNDVFVRDLETGVTERVNVAPHGEFLAGSWAPSISADGRFVVFTSGADGVATGDLDGDDAVFVHDRLTGVTSPVSEPAPSP
jgi:Tol biopolymer transport system component